MASLAILIAFIPLSGHTPACASSPCTLNSSFSAEGHFVTSEAEELLGEPLSNTIPYFDLKLGISICLAPRRPISSQMVKAISISP